MKKQFQAPFFLVFVILAFIVSCKSTQAPPLPESAHSLPFAQAIKPITSPQLRVIFSPTFFNPNEGNLAIYLSAMDESPITGWRVEIREPVPPYLLFFEWKGEGHPPEMISWNGKSAKSELVQPATYYPFTFTVSNAQGQSTAYETRIEVDVFIDK